MNGDTPEPKSEGATESTSEPTGQPRQQAGQVGRRPPHPKIAIQRCIDDIEFVVWSNLGDAGRTIDGVRAALEVLRQELDAWLAHILVAPTVGELRRRRGGDPHE